MWKFNPWRIGNEARCSKWAQLRHVPDSSKAEEWIRDAFKFKDSEAHLKAFNRYVYGSDAGPALGKKGKSAG